jgi:pimeloyl-ACP methyl ester carboxylesterase
VPPDLDFDWIGFGTDVLTAVDALGLEGPVGIGHSCGGAALLLAEAARPGTFSALYCFEPVVVPTGYLRSRDPSSSLARSARQRREVFASRREAYENYSSKPPFNALNPAALAAYVDFGFDDLADGTVRIRCRGENEARIYEGAARHPAYSRLAKVRCPVLIAYGTDTTHFEPGMFDALVQRLPSGRLEAVAGLGHFGPLEQPATVADSVIRAVEPPSA